MHARILLFGWAVLAGCGPTVTPADDEEGTELDDGASEAALLCNDPQPLTQPGPAASPSGFEACADGFVHRAQARQCDPGGFDVGDCENPWNSEGECESDDECVRDDGVAGVCLDNAEPWLGCSCNYGCRSDDDCEDGQACYCDGSRSQCILASCRTDSDCAAGELCGLNERVGACGTIQRALSCTTPADACRVDAECSDCLQCLRWPGNDTARTCSAATGICGPCG